jgi:hypothetical protein
LRAGPGNCIHLVVSQRVPRRPCLALGLPAPRFALKTPGLPFTLALKELDLPLIPGSQTLHGAGPVLLAQPGQRFQRDGGDDHPLMEAAASQHMNKRGQPDQPQRRLVVRT